MSRKLRIEYPGAMDHVMNRGDQREDIFRDDHDRQKFLATLGEACVKTEWQLGKELERLGLAGMRSKCGRALRGTGHRSCWRAAFVSIVTLVYTPAPPNQALLRMAAPPRSLAIRDSRSGRHR